MFIPGLTSSWQRKMMSSRTQSWSRCHVAHNSALLLSRKLALSLLCFFQVFGVVNSFFARDRKTRQRNLKLRTYKVNALKCVLSDRVKHPLNSTALVHSGCSPRAQCRRARMGTEYDNSG